MPYSNLSVKMKSCDLRHMVGASCNTLSTPKKTAKNAISKY